MQSHNGTGTELAVTTCLRVKTYAVFMNNAVQVVHVTSTAINFERPSKPKIPKI